MDILASNGDGTRRACPVPLFATSINRSTVACSQQFVKPLSKAGRG